MPVPRSAHVFVTLGFLVMIGSAGLVQTAAELGGGERPQALEVFDQPPSARNLHEFEHNLDESSLVMAYLRPMMQEARFRLLADAGERALVGRDGWLFYRPSVRYATERPDVAPVAGAGRNADPLPAIRSFHDQLAERGIELLVVPVPDKESIDPEMLSGRAVRGSVVVCRSTRALLDRLQAAGIAFVDLFEAFRQAKVAQSPSDLKPFYLAHDSHWTPAGIRVAVQAVARRIRERGWIEVGAVDYGVRPIEVERVGDLIEMLRVPRLERTIAPERLHCVQVIRRDTGRPYRDQPDARILILGDSFLRIYEQDEPRAAGFIAHLARELKQPLTSIVNDGGASTMVRQDLNRRPRLLANKRLVIWEFVERDIRDGVEGWQVIRLPGADSNRR
ncbi:MAG TPA: hypothetical protein VFF52_12135 [Isosphaeraceae bacterium]|nr:hypothetical protein [Isosphaeraceae bacterium]